MTPISELEEILTKLQIPDDWNLLLIGDGSGSTSEAPGGWSCYVFYNSGGFITERPRMFGGMNRGAPINFLECVQYWLAIRQHYQEVGKDFLKTADACQAHIVTDSQWAAQAMSGHILSEAHSDIKSMYRYYTDRNYRLTWHKVPRATYTLQIRADGLAEQARMAVTWDKEKK